MELAITKNAQRLSELENIINRNLQSFYEVGRSLMEIRDNELYKIKNGGVYDTFEAYCKDVWSMTDRYARNLISSTKVINNVRTGTIVPLTESQTRPLARLEPDQQREAWQKAVDTAPGGKVTAAHVANVVKEVTGEKEMACEDSDAVFQLKRWWKKATIKDKKIFIEWSKNHCHSVIIPPFISFLSCDMKCISHV